MLIFEKSANFAHCKENHSDKLSTQTIKNVRITSSYMSKLIKPQGYNALLDSVQTEQGIKLIKEFFQQNLSTELRLRRVTAPLFVLQGLGRWCIRLRNGRE